MSFTFEKQGGYSTGSYIYDPAEDRWFPLKGLWQVFFSPAEFFAALGIRPSIIIPYLAFAAMIVVYSLFTLNIEIGAMITDMKISGVDINTIPSIEAMRPLMFFSKTVMIFNPLVVTLTTMLLLHVSKSNSDFNKTLSVVIYSEVIYAFGLVLTSFLVILTNNIYASFSFSLLALKLGCEPTSAVFFLISKFNLFFIWQIMVVAVGLQAVFGCSKQRSYLISIISVGCLSILFLLLNFSGKVL